MTAWKPLQIAARLAWLAIGGVCGAWVGFGGYFGVSRNAESFASLLASGFFIALALLGLIAGMAVGGAVGWSVEHALRRLGARTTTALVHRLHIPPLPQNHGPWIRAPHLHRPTPLSAGVGRRNSVELH